MSKLAEMTACDLKVLLDRKETSCVEVMQSVLGEIRAKETDIHAFITLRDEVDLLNDAVAVDNRRARVFEHLAVGRFHDKHSVDPLRVDIVKGLRQIVAKLDYAQRWKGVRH